jgi:PAS domain S-box-containing protein
MLGAVSEARPHWAVVAVSGGDQDPGLSGVEDPTGSESRAIEEAAALGLPALAGIVAGAQQGIAVVDAGRRFVYANPAACELMGYPLEELRGRDFMDSIPPRDHAIMSARFSERYGGSLGEAPAPFTFNLRDREGAEHEVVYSTVWVEIAGKPHLVAIFDDLTGTRAAGRAAMALAQVASQLVGAGTIDEILAGIARHSVEGTRALASGVVVVGEDDQLAAGGSYGFPARIQSREAWTAASVTLGDLPGGELLLAGKSALLPDARLQLEAHQATKGFAATLASLDWQAGVFLPLLWGNRVLGVFGAYLPAGLSGPSEAELAFYTALADQAAVGVVNIRLTSQATQAAALVERARLARELHDSVSQGLFSMTLHAQAAKLAMIDADVEEGGPLGRSIDELATLTRSALAEMRALIFELRPAALAEEGLVSALRKQAAVLSDRESLVIAVEGPEESLELTAEVEEHLYRIVSEALNNVVKHAGAEGATVSVTVQAGGLSVVVRDDGVGFDQDSVGPGRLGLSTMAERAETIGAQLAITSAPGVGTTVAVFLPATRSDKRAPDAG